MQWEECSQLQRSALGRFGFIGELYDARREKYSSRSIFRKQFVDHFIQCIQITNMICEYKFTNYISDRFDLLNVEADMQVSLLCGMVDVGGSAKFLTEDKKSQKNISCSLICRFQTVCEKLFASLEEIMNYIDLRALEDEEFTHFIVETNWGANSILHLEQNYESESHKKIIEGNLTGEFSKLASILTVKGNGQVNSSGYSFSEKNNAKIKIITDATPDDEIPTSVESFLKFLSNIPRLLKKINDGKGVPISHKMVPLSSLRKFANVNCSIENTIRTIDESFLISTVCLFEEISEMKQKFNDLISEMSTYRKYLLDSDLAKGKKHLETLKQKESQLKSMIADDWLSIRSGVKNLTDLVRKVERFKSRDLNLCIYEENLNSFQSIRKRIKVIENFLSRGADYLGKEVLLVDEINRNLSLDIIALIVSSNFQNANPVLHQSTSYYFLTLVEEKLPKTKYIVVDLDLDSEHNSNEQYISLLGVTNVRCLHLRGGNILCQDKYEEHILEKATNFARPVDRCEVKNVQHKPGNRTLLELTCPGFDKGLGCSSEKVRWKCFRCRKSLEYGFDESFYCCCGQRNSFAYEYRCCSCNHGTSFIKANDESLKQQLSSLRPVKELNILVLGQSGVGKSTWINSIVNYLTYNSLQEAKENGVVCTIPIAFTAYDKETAKRHTIEIGKQTVGEVTDAGKSATQFCSTYTFQWQGTYVRLIDTPGLGDTRGIERDKQNIRSIMDHISHLKELHGICILLKANDCRISAIFSYCLKEFLIYMHKNAAKNIVFCFTNARNSFYTPGQTSVLLEKQFERMDIQNDLSLGYHNSFCLDNEAFLFLCTLQYPNIRHEEDLVKSFAQSWDISLKETVRLFSTIQTFKPHSLQDTLSLFTARHRILFLSKPIAEISKTIQLNLATIARKKEELNTSEKTLEELSKKLFVDEIHLEPVLLSRPRTVCTSPKCVRYHKIEDLDITEVEYITHCHKECYVKNVEPKSVNNSRLWQYCNALKSGTCNVCGCGWQTHMHVTFGQKRTKKQGISKFVERNMLKEKSDKEKIQEFVETLEAKTEKYEEEQNFVIRVSVKFGMFLKENAVTVYNDAVADYLTYLIEEEENKPHKTESDKMLLRNLKSTLEQYEAEVKILQEVVQQSGNSTAVPTVQEVYQMEQELYGLEFFGQDIKRNVEAGRTASSSVLSYNEIFVKMPEKRSSEPKVKNKKENKSSWKLNLFPF